MNNIKIQYKTYIPEENKNIVNDIIKIIVDSVIPTVGDSKYNNPLLSDINIIVDEDSGIVNTVNKIIKEIGNSERTYIPPSTVPDGFTIPLIVNSKLIIYILFRSSFIIEKLNSKVNSLESLSTFLEELLHARIYTINYQSRKYIMPEEKTIRTDLFIIASRLHDEHLTSRIKSPIIKGIYNGELLYRGDVNRLLNESCINFISLCNDYFSKKINLQQYWESTTDIIYRNIFEPLARDYGFKSGNKVEYSDFLPSMFYQKYVLKYWKDIKNLLDVSYESKLNNIDNSIEGIIIILINFLDNIGIHYNEDKKENITLDINKIKTIQKEQ